LLTAKYRNNFTVSELPAATHSTMSLSNSKAQISKISGRAPLPFAPAREPVFWRVEGRLLNLTAVRPVGFFAWNSQSFLERWTRRGAMAILALARPFLYITDRVFARLLRTGVRFLSGEVMMN
jgi:hypothetical protein